MIFNANCLENSAELLAKASMNLFCNFTHCFIYMVSWFLFDYHFNHWHCHCHCYCNCKSHYHQPRRRHHHHRHQYYIIIGNMRSCRCDPNNLKKKYKCKILAKEIRRSLTGCSSNDAGCSGVMGQQQQGTYLCSLLTPGS